MKVIVAGAGALPTQLHARRAIQCMDAGKHVAVEIPVSDSLAGAKAVLAKQQETGLVCQVGHTRRYNPPHHWIHNKYRGQGIAVECCKRIPVLSNDARY